MGIRKRTYYIIKCDKCGYEMENGEGGTLCLESKLQVHQHIFLAGWTKRNGKIACESCYEKI